MVRMQTQIRTLLEAALAGTGAQLSYAYPQWWQTGGAMVSFVESENSCMQRCEPPYIPGPEDGKTEYPYEGIQRVVYTVDVWSPEPEKNWDIFARINRAMTAFGFVRESSGDLYEMATRLHHRTSRYAAQINLIDQEIS